jgi:hypothetical protein
LPRDLPPWYVVYQQMQRWLTADCFELLVGNVRSLLREWGGRKGQPKAVVVDSRTLQSTLESGARAGYDGAKRRKGSKVHIVVDTLGHLLALAVTAADQGDREQVRAGGRRECHAGGELSCLDGAGRMDASSGKHGSNGSEREATSEAFFRVRKQFGEIW